MTPRVLTVSSLKTQLPVHCITAIAGCVMIAGGTEHKNRTKGMITRFSSPSLEKGKVGSGYVSLMLGTAFPVCRFSLFANHNCPIIHTEFLKIILLSSVSTGDGDVLRLRFAATQHSPQYVVASFSSLQRLPQPVPGNTYSLLRSWFPQSIVATNFSQ